MKDQDMQYVSIFLKKKNLETILNIIEPFCKTKGLEWINWGESVKQSIQDELGTKASSDSVYITLPKKSWEHINEIIRNECRNRNKDWENWANDIIRIITISKAGDDEYYERVNIITKKYIRDDEKKRKTMKLNKNRTDSEAMKYRNYFDTNYIKLTSDYINAIKTNIGILPDSPFAISFSKDLSPINYRKFLDKNMYIPHGLANLLDYQTNSRGNSTDIARFCNLLALSQVLIVIVDARKSSNQLNLNTEYRNANIAFLEGFQGLSFHDVPYSEGGTMIGNFIYWLIYDGKSLNLDMLNDLAEKTKGNISYFIHMINLYWLFRNSGPNVKIFYKEIIPMVNKIFKI